MSVQDKRNPAGHDPGCCVLQRGCQVSMTHRCLQSSTSRRAHWSRSRACALRKLTAA